MILVTGATGHLGTAVINQLLENTSRDKFIALARNEEKANALKEKGVQVRMADLNDIASLDEAVKGIDKILLISTVDDERYQQHKNMIDAAKRADVKRISYTSALLRDINKSKVESLLRTHFQTEEYIKESGLDYSIFRNALYTDVIPMYAGDNIFEHGIFLPAGDGKAAYALRREMGEAIANELMHERSKNKIYELTGSELYSYHDVAEILSEISGKKVTYTDADINTFPQVLKELGVPEQMIVIASGFTIDVSNHQYEIVTEDLENLLGRKPALLKEALTEIYGF